MQIGESVQRGWLPDWLLTHVEAMLHCLQADSHTGVESGMMPIAGVWQRRWCIAFSHLALEV